MGGARTTPDQDRGEPENVGRPEVGGVIPDLAGERECEDQHQAPCDLEIERYLGTL